MAYAEARVICTDCFFLGSSVADGGDSTLFLIVTCCELFTLESFGVVVSIDRS